MIVDDERRTRQGLATLVDWESYGFTITNIAADATEAMELFEKRRPSLMIVDIKMPGISGIKLIEAIRKKDQKICFLILSGHAEFDYAKKAIQYHVSGYLLKPVDEEELLSYLVEIKKNLDLEKTSHHANKKGKIEKLIQAALSDEITTEAAVQLQQMIYWNKFTIILIKCYKKNDLDLKQMLKESLQESVPFTKDSYLGIVIEQKGEAVTIPSELDNLLGAYGISYFSVRSQAVGKVEDLATCYREALELMRKSFFYIEDQIVTKDSLHIREYVEESRISLSALEEQFVYSVEIGDWSNIHPLIWKITASLEAKEYTEAKIKKRFIQLLSSIVNTLSTEYPEKRETFSHKLYELTEIEYLYHVTQLVEFIHQFIKETVELIDCNKEKIVVNKMIHLIEQNYHKNIKLDNIAEVVHYHKVYLGKLFKAHTGEYFNTYLDKVRMENGKKFLLQGFKVYQVAEKVGYSNPDYFHSKFKKYVGMSPSTFRKKSQKKEFSKKELG